MLRKIINSDISIAATGVTNLPIFEINGHSQFIEMKSSGLTGTAKLQQSIDNETFYDIEDSSQTISDTMAWNLALFPRGMNMRISVTLTDVSDASVKAINMFSNE